MLWWFAETTLIAGVLAGLAALLGRHRTMDPTARHLLWLVVLIKFVTPPVIHSPWAVPRPELDWPVGQPGPSEAPAPRPEVVPVCWEPDMQFAFSAPERAEPPVREAAAPPVQEAVLAEVGKVEIVEPEPEPRLAAGAAGPAIDPASIRRWLLGCWGLATLILAFAQATRIVRFSRRLADAVPAPDWLVEEAEQLGARLQVRVPELLAVPGLGTPMLWCLGRPKLLLPVHMIKSIGVARWRGILAHELAHLRRGDHWVSRLELAAGLAWWWNPLYWLARRRLDAEAELACDAWVVWTLPEERLAYAEVLLQISSKFSTSGSPAPALGVAGTGRFFERRLCMILHDRASCRVSPAVLLMACLLAFLGLPSWTLARPSALIVPAQEPSRPEAGASAGPSEEAAVAADDEDEDDAKDDDGDDDDDDKAKADDDDDDDDAKDDDDDDDKAKAKDLKSKSREDRKARKSGDARKEKKKDKDKDKDIETGIEAALGPDFEKKIEAWAEKFSKEVEDKFGDNSEFVKKMEALGKEMEKKFGDNSEFAKKMEAMGKEMEKKFGPGSEFEKAMKEKFGPGSEFEKAMKEKFGPGSDFEKKMKEQLGPGSEFEKKMKEQLGPGSEFEKKMKAFGDQVRKKAAEKHEAKETAEKHEAKETAEKHEAEARAARSARDQRRTEVRTARQSRREQRVKALEEKIQLLMKELKELKAAEEEPEHEE